MRSIVGEFLSWSVDVGFLLVLPLHHGDLELDSVRVSTKSYVAICHGGWGGYLRDKNTCARTSIENVGRGGLYVKGGVYAGRYGTIIITTILCHQSTRWLVLSRPQPYQ